MLPIIYSATGNIRDLENWHNELITLWTDAIPDQTEILLNYKDPESGLTRNAPVIRNTTGESIITKRIFPFIESIDQDAIGFSMSGFTSSSQTRIDLFNQICESMIVPAKLGEYNLLLVDDQKEAEALGFSL